MRNSFSIIGENPEKQWQLVGRGLKSCLKAAELGQGCGSWAPRKLIAEQGLLTLRNGFLSERTGLVIIASLPSPSVSSARRSSSRMFTHSAVPRTLLRQGLHGLLGPGDGVGVVSAQMRKLHWVSVASRCPIADTSLGSSDCCWRAYGTKASGRGKKKEAGMVSEEGSRQRASKASKRRSDAPAGAHLPSAETTGTTEAVVVAQSSDNCGAIHLIVGPMFAGKSTALLHRVQEEASSGRRVALVKSDKDTRYGLSAIVTHDGLQMPCYAVPDLTTFKTKVGDKFYKELDVIGIDEAQFFTDLYEFCQNAADFEGKTLIVAGLDGDFLRRRFGSTLDLTPVADSVVKLSSRCEICGRPAMFTFRKTLDTHRELVGGADVYMPVCRQHFVNGQIVVETASTVIGAHQVAQMNND